MKIKWKVLEILLALSAKNSIEFSNVSFSYDSGELLKNISLKIHQGEIIGLVGASGSAKTTLIKLLSRQLDPCSGEIYVNGHNIKNYSYKGYTCLLYTSPSPRD